MEVYLIRHADAGTPNTPAYPDDRLRPLSALGRKSMKEVARGMKRGGIKIDALCASSLVRARQTAEIVAKAYRIPLRRIKTLAALAPDQIPSRAVSELRKMGKLRRVAFVGHEPHLSTLAAHLVSKQQSARIDLKKAGVCRIDLDQFAAGGGVLVFLLTPKLSKAL